MTQLHIRTKNDTHTIYFCYNILCIELYLQIIIIYLEILSKKIDLIKFEGSNTKFDTVKGRNPC